MCAQVSLQMLYGSTHERAVSLKNNHRTVADGFRTSQLKSYLLNSSIPYRL